MIPDEVDDWAITIRAGRTLAATLTHDRARALLFKEIATVRTDAPVAKSVADLEWKQPARNFEEFCVNNRMEALVSRMEKLLGHRT